MNTEFTDPRLVEIYDAVNSYAADAQPGFYSQLAAELGANSIIDLGCGTGMITCELARQGYQLIGVEPAPAMLDIARHRACGDQVSWIEGSASELGTPNADLAIMTGHVAQFFLTDESWQAALRALHRALRPGGWLAFESRNPAAQEWENWSAQARRSADDPIGRIDTWMQFHDVREGIVSYTIHYLFAATGEEIESPGELRFRTETELRHSLTDAGFTVRRVYGDWDRRPVRPATRELIVVAAR